MSGLIYPGKGEVAMLSHLTSWIERADLDWRVSCITEAFCASVVDAQRACFSS